MNLHHPWFFNDSLRYDYDNMDSAYRAFGGGGRIGPYDLYWAYLAIF